eukprot:TRINITY_DN21390_c0_g2_i4.p2 TRINITY_DN21390_c0_g2~~TRINITY_DN21390_c0_g2_i4.p2  ORF type:complete len:159 (+),score=10.15 TRINITY_DN21390_c0_g2_i4:177-653(+)
MSLYNQNGPCNTKARKSMMITQSLMRLNSHALPKKCADKEMRRQRSASPTQGGVLRPAEARRAETLGEKVGSYLNSLTFKASLRIVGILAVLAEPGMRDVVLPAMPVAQQREATIQRQPRFLCAQQACKPAQHAIVPYAWHLRHTEDQRSPSDARLWH